METALYRQNVVLTSRVRASAQQHTERSRLFLRVEFDGVAGYGEVAPQPYQLNGDPGFAQVVVATSECLARLRDVVGREAALPLWSRVARFSSGSPQENAAVALVEMALLDRELRATSRSIAELWPRRFDTPNQATVSLLSDEPWQIDESVGRVRVKCAPGAISGAAFERLETLRVPVIVDYNCSALSDDDVLRQLKDIARVATVAAVEQPYQVGNVIDHARLAARLDVTMSIDEGLRSTRDLLQIANYHAATMICVKPARVGGLANARTLIERARVLELTPYLGGFFESPYARGVHRSLAEHCVSAPSDIGLVDVTDVVHDEARSLAVSFGVEPSLNMLAVAEPLSVISSGES